MPNIRHRTIKEDPDLWPTSLDDLRRNPGRLVDLPGLARLGVVVSYDGAKKLPKPLDVPSEKKTWEGRTILAAIGANLELPDDAQAEADPAPGLKTRP